MISSMHLLNDYLLKLLGLNLERTVLPFLKKLGATSRMFKPVPADALLMTAYIASTVQRTLLSAELVAVFTKADAPSVENVFISVLITKKRFATFLKSHLMSAMVAKNAVTVPSKNTFMMLIRLR